MLPTIVRRRRRVLAALTTTTALFAGTVATTAAPAESLPPTGDCKTAYDISALSAGQAVRGLTVTRDTTPEPFTGEVLGVLDDGIAPGVDMVMARLTSTELDRVGGIWQGMSGSPVYTADGDLIGAVAYGLSWGPSLVAGITPFAAMDDYLGTAPPAAVRVGRSAARAIAAATDVTTTQAEQGFTALPMPTGVSGVGSRRLAQAGAKGRAYLPKSAYAMGAAAAPGDGPGVETIVAGGNIAASLSYGDILQAGLGTATSVCNGQVVGFGHPMAMLGRTTMAIHPADALYIQEDPVSAAFKVANLGGPVGTITDDHTTGITGVLGPLPDTTAITSTVNYNSRTRTGSSNVAVPQAEAATTFYQITANHDRVLDAWTKGSEVLSWTITGDTNGTPFTLAFVDRYASASDITFESPWELADLVWALSSMPGVSVDDVAATSDVTDDNSTWRVAGFQQWRAGAWQPVGRGAPVIARAGKKLLIRVKLAGVSGSRFVGTTFMVPARAAGQRGGLSAMGGNDMWTEGEQMDTVAQVSRMLSRMTRNDQIDLSLSLFGETGRSSANRTVGPTDKVVNGYKEVKVLVR